MPDGQATGFPAKPAVGGALVVGEIKTVVGACTLTRPGGDPFPIKTGDPICSGDIIETTAGGKVGIRFIDGTAFNLSDSARVVVKEFSGDGAQPCALFDSNLGTFAFVAGEMAKLGGLRIETPFASLRGRAHSSGIGMLSLASLFFAALEDAQGLTLPPGVEEGIINIKESSDILNAPFGIVELNIAGQIIYLDDPTEEVVVRGSSVTRIALTPAQLLRYQAESNNVSNISGMGQASVGGASGSGGLAPEPPPFLTPINNTLPTGPIGGPPSGGGSGGSGGAALLEIIPPPPAPPPPPPPAGPNEINEIFATTNSPTIDTSTGDVGGTIQSVANPPTFVW